MKVILTLEITATINDPEGRYNTRYERAYPQYLIEVDVSTLREMVQTVVNGYPGLEAKVTYDAKVHRQLETTDLILLK